MPYAKLSDANPAIRGIEPKVSLAQANEIADWADSIERVESPWAVAISQFKKVYKAEGGKWVKKEDDMGEVTVTTTTAWDNQTVTVADNAKISAIPELPPGTLTSQGETTTNVTEQDPPEACVCPDCGHEQDKERGVACRSVECPECGAMMVAKIEEVEEDETEEEVEEVGKRLNAKQITNLNAALDTIKGLLGWANYEDKIPEVVVESFTESASGRVVGLVEAKPVLPDSVVPLHLDAILIEPGWGNEHDGHYYPKDVLERDAKVFAGAKMYESDHRQGEKSTRTWVSTVKEIAGFTDDGAPIGRVSIHDKNFAERVLALDADDLLEKMECSILAGGTAKKGKIDGKKAKIVESITEAESVDWVTRAGAGGRAHALVETEEGSMEENETDLEEQETEEVQISEDSEPEVPEPLSDEKVTARLGETNLPKASQKRLSVEYADEESLEEAVLAEIAYVKELTGSGDVFGMDGEPQSQEPLTEAEKTKRFNEHMRAVGGREV